MDVALLIPSTSGGGAEFVALEWGKYLANSGVNVTFIVTHQTKSSKTDSQLPIIELNSTSFFKRILELRSHLRQTCYDVVISLMPHWNVLSLLAVRSSGRVRPKTIISGRNIESGLKTIQGRGYKFELLLSRFLYRRADGYVAISHPVGAEAAARYGIPLEKIWVVPNPATGKLAIREVEIQRSRRSYASSSSRLTISVPARIVAQKRPTVAIDCAALLRQNHGIDVVVEFFGTGPEQEAVEQRAKSLGVPVVFHGWVDNWYEHCADDSIVLLPSLVEGFGNVLVEAAAVGIPSVASSRALGVADAIVPNITGALSVGDSADELSEAIIEASRIGTVNAPDWLERFSASTSGRILSKAISEVLANREAPKLLDTSVPV